MTPDEFLATLFEGEPTTPDEAARPFRCERLGCTWRGEACAKRHRRAQRQKTRWREGRPRRSEDIRHFECIDCPGGVVRLKLLSDALAEVERRSVMGRYASRRRKGPPARTYAPPPCTYCGRERKRTTRPPEDPLHGFCSICQADVRRRLRNNNLPITDDALVEALQEKVRRRAAKATS